jgi:MinD-like ATPase involved in chromosome partitioning or flagellar assembly
MSERLRLATLAGTSDAEATLAAELSSRSDLELVLRCVDRVELLALFRSRSVDVVISVGAPRWLDAETVEEGLSAGIRLLGVAGDPLENEHLRRLGVRVAAGTSIDEILATATDVPLPLPPTIAKEEDPQGRLIAVWGPKGSPGRTTMAIEMSHRLCAVDPDTLLIDADGFGGDVVQYLGIVEELPTVVWAARLAGSDELDPTQLARALRRSGPMGPVVVPGVPRSQLAAEISDYGWRHLLEVARATFSFTVCDVGFCIEPPGPSQTGDGRNHIARTTLKEASHIVAVCRADAVGVKNFLWAFDELKEMVDPSDVSVIVNRVVPGDEREVADVLRKHVGKKAAAYIREDVDRFRTAVRTGRAVSEDDPSSDVATALDGLLANLGAKVPARGFLARIGGRS